jgi:hypothetical protein
MATSAIRKIPTAKFGIKRLILAAGSHNVPAHLKGSKVN